MALNLACDQIVKGRIYPALAQHQGRPYTASWREFGQHWPYTIPLRLQEYCDHHGIKLSLSLTNDVLPNCWYPIGLGFFDFAIDYFALLPANIVKQVQQHHIKILFYYHEGDNPERIKQRLDHLVQQHRLHHDCYCFVSANTAARKLPGFVYFNDFELWYWQRNANVDPTPVHSNPRTHDFTALVRLHKTWRAIAMADLWQRGLLDQSQWSYCETGTIEQDSPIEIDVLALRPHTENFLQSVPHLADTLSQQERNNHSSHVSQHYSNSWCNIVFETHFDADASGGVFITEKTFKPIKHGQLFFVAGCANTLAELRAAGYSVFDSVLDTAYDSEPRHTQRWQLLSDSIAYARPHLASLFKQARPSIEHNQQHFIRQKRQQLNRLLEQIHEKT